MARHKVLQAGGVVAALMLAAAAGWSARGAARPPDATHGDAPALDSMAREGGELPADLPDPDSGAELIGRPAPELAVTRWARGGPLRMHGLRGKVVLVRFWTERCRFCRATLPALERLRDARARDGFVVIAVFHPLRPHLRRSDAEILRAAREIGFDGPIAVDQDWRTLGRWWLDGHPDRNWLSASFLVDRDGIVRWVQGGGEYHPSSDPRHARCDLEYRDLERTLASLLAAPDRRGPAIP